MCWFICQATTKVGNDVETVTRIFKTLCQKLTYVMCRKKHHNFLCVHKQPSSACWSETVCNKTRDLLTRFDWKFYVLERLWSWHVLVIDNDYDHGICWRSIVSMIMTCVGDQEWLWSWHVLAIKLIRTNEETDQGNKTRNLLTRIDWKFYVVVVLRPGCTKICWRESTEN